MDKKNVFFADYMDYSIEKGGRRPLSPFEQLNFDLLCFYPAQIVLTLTSTLIDTGRVNFIDFDRFWRSNSLKIHFTKGDSADKYLSRKLHSLNDFSDDNYEAKLYITNTTDYFVNNYLKKTLSEEKVDYVYHRISDADKNNREMFLANLEKYEREIIEDPLCPMSMEKFDDLALIIQELAYSSSFTFQRSCIINELIARKLYQETQKIPMRILSMFDLSYNEAMAKSIGATTLSTINTTLNGIGLRNFIKGYSPKIYSYIKSMSPEQIFLLAKDQNWQIYRNFISELYEHLLNKCNLTQSSDLYKRTIKYENKNFFLNFCIDKMAEIVFDKIKHINPMIYVDVLKTKENTKVLVKNYLLSTQSVEYYCSEEIVKRTKFIEIICEDILHKRYK